MFFFYVVVCALAVALYDGVVQNVGEIKPFSFRVNKKARALDMGQCHLASLLLHSPIDKIIY